MPKNAYGWPWGQSPFLSIIPELYDVWEAPIGYHRLLKGSYYAKPYKGLHPKRSGLHSHLVQ